MSLSDATDTPLVATREEGLRRLVAFLPRAGRAYGLHRNDDLGPARRDNVSGLSPYVRYRLVTEREIAMAVLNKHGAEASRKFIEEVLWRTYWKGWLEMRPAVWSRFCAERDAARAEAGEDVAAAEAGTTGIEGFDDWARELVETGTLHNHARMWFASIWIFTLRLPWTLGADFFLRHLTDADPASNTLSWRWVAGLQTRGKTYLATTDNIARHTGGRFAPKGLATVAEPLGEDAVETRPLPHPDPEPANTPALLLIHGEDLDAGSLVKGDIRGVIAVRGAPGWPWGTRAGAFLAEGVADSIARARSGTVLEDFDVGAIVAAAEAAKVTTIVTAHAPVGPVADALATLAPALAAAGLTLTRKRRPWDEVFWPRATKGYFAFRETIPERLAKLGLRG